MLEQQKFMIFITQKSKISLTLGVENQSKNNFN